jgi:hypothetical protein
LISLKSLLMIVHHIDPVPGLEKVSPARGDSIKGGEHDQGPS